MESKLFMRYIIYTTSYISSIVYKFRIRILYTIHSYNNLTSKKPSFQFILPLQKVEIVLIVSNEGPRVKGEITQSVKTRSVQDNQPLRNLIIVHWEKINNKSLTFTVRTVELAWIGSGFEIQLWYHNYPIF